MIRLDLRMLRRSLLLALPLAAAACQAPLQRQAGFDRGGDGPQAIAARYQDAPEDEGAPAKRGAFISVMGAYTTLENDDFDGESGLVAPPNGEVFFLPELDSGTGYGASIGYRGVENSIQFTFTRTTHDDDFLGTSMEDEIDTYSLDAKHYWRVHSRLQPYVLVGITVPRFLIEDGAADPTLTNVTDAKYQGLGTNLGGGAAFYVTPSLSLHAELYYRWAFMNDVDGAGVSRTIKGDLDGSGFGARAGISYTF
jgi:opacity protein-like surface antigen